MYVHVYVCVYIYIITPSFCLLAPPPPFSQSTGCSSPLCSPSSSLTSRLDPRAQLSGHSLVCNLYLLAPYLLLCQSWKSFPVDRPIFCLSSYMRAPEGNRRNSHSWGLSSDLSWILSMATLGQHPFLPCSPNCYLTPSPQHPCPLPNHGHPSLGKWLSLLF